MVRETMVIAEGLQGGGQKPADGRGFAMSLTDLSSILSRTKCIRNPFDM